MDAIGIKHTVGGLAGGAAGTIGILALVKGWARELWEAYKEWLRMRADERAAERAAGNGRDRFADDLLSVMKADSSANRAVLERIASGVEALVTSTRDQNIALSWVKEKLMDIHADIKAVQRQKGVA